MSDFGLGDEAIESLFLQLDTNSDGEIDLSEFLAGWDAFASASAPAPPPAETIDFMALDAAVKSGVEQGRAVLICDPSERASGFLAYNALTLDCKGTFVLNKIKGMRNAEIQEKARKKLVVAIKTGQWLHMELGKSAPSFDEFESDDAFPALALLQPGFGKDDAAQSRFVRPEDKTDGVWLPRGDWAEFGHGVVLTTAFQPEEYRELLAAAWPQFPWSKLVELVVSAPEGSGTGGLDAGEGSKAPSGPVGGAHQSRFVGTR